MPPSFKVRSPSPPPPPPPPPPRRPSSSARDSDDSNKPSSKDSTNAATKAHLPVARGWSTVSSATDNTAVEVSFVDADVHGVHKTTFTCSDDSDDNNSAASVPKTSLTTNDASHHNKSRRRCFWVIAIFIAVAALAVAIALGAQVLQQSKRTHVQEAPAPVLDTDEPQASVIAGGDDQADANIAGDSSDDGGLLLPMVDGGVVVGRALFRGGIESIFLHFLS